MKNNIVKDILRLFSGSLVSKLVVFLSSPVLARIYAPEHFGTFAFCSSIIMFLGPILALRFNDAIPIASKNSEAKRIVEGSISLALISSSTIAILAIIYGSLAKDIYWIAIVSISILGSLFYSLYETVSFFCVRNKQFKDISISQIHQSLLGSLSKISLGLLGFLSSGLVIGHCIQQFFGIKRLITSEGGWCNFRAVKSRFKSNLLILNKYLDYPKFRLSSKIALGLSQQMPIFMFGLMYGGKQLGLFSLTMSTLSIPLTIISQNVRKVYYGYVSNNECSAMSALKLTNMSLLITSLLSIPIWLVLFFYGEDVYTFVYGEQWRVSGIIATIMATYLVLNLICSPIMDYLNVVGKLSVYFKFNIFRLFLVSSLLFFSYINEFDFLKLISYYSYLMSGLFLLQIMVVYHFIIESVRRER
ncbi:lipopolysaccharide biosynthesis protein [Vibrio cyclitrophicus]|uniref:lipopolysaccharide biosynthesis protein n=1 Tax=Vibrio cyclitrophicus TaxID=47951 RepID=UPI00399977E6